MARNILDIKIDVSKIERLQASLAAMDAETLSREIVKTLNEVANDTYDIARSAMISTINLDESYVRNRMEVREAAANKPTASIVAKGTNTLLTGLGHYGALQLGQSARWSEEDGMEMGYKIGPWPKWEPRRGDPSRGLDSGEKQAGFQVQVKRGNAKKMPGVFTIPGKVHSDGSPVLFKGTGAAGRGVMDRKRKQSRQGVEALYGPSVYQLFRTAATKIADQTADSLENAIVDTALREFEKVLK